MMQPTCLYSVPPPQARRAPRVPPTRPVHPLRPAPRLTGTATRAAFDVSGRPGAPRTPGKHRRLASDGPDPEAEGARVPPAANRDARRDGELEWFNEDCDLVGSQSHVLLRALAHVPLVGSTAPRAIARARLRLRSCMALHDPLLPPCEFGKR